MELKRLSISSSAQQSLYAWLSIGIIYSFLFWTLLNSICCILLFVCWLLLTPKSFAISSGRTRLMLLFTTLYLISILGMCYTGNSKEGLSRLQEKVPILLFPLIFGTTRVLTAGLVKKIAAHFVTATAISCACGIVYGLWQYLHTGLIDDITGRHLLVFSDMYPYLLGLCALLSMIMILSGLVSPSPFRQSRLVSPSPSHKTFRLTILILFSVSIVLLGTRVIVACWLLTCLIAVFAVIPGLTRRLLTGAALAGFCTLIVCSIPSLRAQWKELTVSGSNNTIPLDRDASLGRNWGGRSIREAIWKCGSDVVRRHWLAGVGTGDIQDSLQAAYEARQFYFASRYNRYNAHNQYLQILIGHGVIGLCILALCIGVPIGLLFTPSGWTADPSYNASRICYLAFLLLFCIICFTEVILDINKGIIWYSFFNSIFAFSALFHHSSKIKN